jgi:hypothetical protein
MVLLQPQSDAPNFQVSISRNIVSAITKSQIILQSKNKTSLLKWSSFLKHLT